MDEEPKQPAPASPAPPSANQNLIVGIVLGAVVLLLLLLVISQQFNSNVSSKKDDRLEQIKKEFDEAIQAHATAKAGSGLANTQNAEALSVKIKQDVDALTGLLTTQQGNISRLQGYEATVQSLSRQNTDLQNRLTQANAAAQRVPSLEAQLAALSADVAAADNRLANAVDQTKAEALEQQLSTARDEIMRLEAALTKARNDALNMVDRNELAVLKAQSAPLEEMNLALRRELQKIRAEADRDQLFVSSDQLSPRATKLFSELVRLEGSTGTALRQAYERIGKNLNARPVETMTFKSNSSAIAIEREDHLKKITENALANSFFLVVGYASKTGDLQNNRELSAKRATRAASVVKYLKSAGQDVQAVYLGETSRFGATDGPNQCCEVWEINP